MNRGQGWYFYPGSTSGVPSNMLPTDIARHLHGGAKLDDFIYSWFYFLLNSISKLLLGEKDGGPKNVLKI